MSLLAHILSYAGTLMNVNLCDGFKNKIVFTVAKYNIIEIPSYLLSAMSGIDTDDLA